MHKNFSCAKKLTSVLGVTSEPNFILGFLFGVLKGVDLGVGGECPFVAAPLAFVAAPFGLVVVEEGEEASTTLRAFLAGDGSGEDSELEREEGEEAATTLRAFLAGDGSGEDSELEREEEGDGTTDFVSQKLYFY